jgi:hypothetical protein
VVCPTNIGRQYKEAKALRLIMKHLRHRGLMTAFETLGTSLASSPFGIRFEHPLLTTLHHALVVQGDFDQAEAILSKAAFRPIKALDLPEDDSATASGPTLFSEYIEETCSPQPIWTRLDLDPSTHSVDDEKPSPRGGHQLVFVPRHGDEQAGVYLFGGWNGQQELDDLWWFGIDPSNPTKGRWKLLQSSSQDCGGPGPRSCHKMCLHPSTGDIYLLGRFIDLSDRQGPDAPKPDAKELACDFWKLTTRGPDAGTWEELNSDTKSDGGPKLVYDHQMAIDDATGTLVLFGGKVVSAEPEAEYSGMYTYHLGDRLWIFLRYVFLQPQQQELDRSRVEMIRSSTK